MRTVIFRFGLDIASLDCLDTYTEALRLGDSRGLPGAWPGLTLFLSRLTDATLEARGWLGVCVCWIAWSVLLLDLSQPP